HASARASSTVLRAGTYVTGTSPGAPISSSGRSLGTAIAGEVSADAAIGASPTSTTRWSAAPSADATRAAAASSTSWSWPYRTVSAWHTKPRDRAIASVVVESRPPDRRTTAAVTPAL